MTPFSRRFPHNIISKIMGHCNENIIEMMDRFTVYQFTDERYTLVPQSLSIKSPRTRINQIYANYTWKLSGRKQNTDIFLFYLNCEAFYHEHGGYATLAIKLHCNHLRTYLI